MLGSRVIVLIIFGVLLLAAVFFTQRFRTTASDVRGWLAALPKTAGPDEVKELLESKGMTCTVHPTSVSGVLELGNFNTLVADVQFDEQHHLKDYDVHHSSSD